MRFHVLLPWLLSAPCLAALELTAVGSEPNPPEWATSVHVFSPSDANITEYVADLLRDLNNVTTGHYSNERIALLFKPGTYNVEIEVGYYVQVLGLGERADDVVFEGKKGVYSKPMGVSPDPGSLDNFWRGAENFRSSAENGMLWAVSQACPIRRIHVDKNLSLFLDGAWASGGYMADIQVDGRTMFGGQQQFFIRNSAVNTPDKKVLGGNWNMVFVGTTGAPPTSRPDGEVEAQAVTNIATTPVIAEKPYISIDSVGLYTLQVPLVKFRSVGPSLNASGASEARAVPFSNVFVAKTIDATSLIQAKLDQGLHVILSPGIYSLSTPLTLTHNDQVLLGIGMATLVCPSDGNPCVRVASGVDGARIAGLMLQAASAAATRSVMTSTLLEWGEAATPFVGNPANPGVMSDIFARVGGPDVDRSIGVDVVIRVYSGNVIGDDLWLWRADHALLDPLKGKQPDPVDSAVPLEKRVAKAKEYYLPVSGDYPSKTGLEVLGDQVTMYGLMVEHHLQDNTIWRGEGGQVFFYQNELPYDVSQASFCDKGYTGYMVADGVKSHEGYGLGVYSFFRDHQCLVKSPFKSPQSDGVRFHNIFTRYLNGHSGLETILDGSGQPAMGTWQSPAKERTVMGRMATSMKNAETCSAAGATAKEVHVGVGWGTIVIACMASAFLGLLSAWLFFRYAGRARSSSSKLDETSDEEL